MGSFCKIFYLASRINHINHDKRTLSLSQERPPIDETLYKDWEVVYNPAVQHWYLVGGCGEFRRNRINTRKGEVDADSLTKKDIVDCFFRINIEAFGPYDILFMRNSKGHIAIFTLIEGDDMGKAYRTDRCGFGYKSVRFYFNTCYKRLTGDVHFIVTETQDGKWGLFAIGHPHVSNAYSYPTTLSRQLFVQGGIGTCQLV